ncbi:MAG: glucoamylase family protein [Chloroflexota bacterium]|nr:glucoamylase family protein [Chloroflexota bacterium]
MIATDSAPSSLDDQSGLSGSASGASQLDDLAIRLAESHTISSGRRPLPSLLDRLRGRASLLREAREYFRQMPDVQRALSYTAEWLLDNFYVVQQALRQVREDMPLSYYRQLPKLDASPLEGYPRAYGLAREIIGYCECHLDLDRVMRFVHTYQQVTPLTMGELWATPTMLRLGILEYLAQAVARVTGLREGDSLDEELPALASLPPDLTDDAIVANCILSLRMLATQDWNAFFENVSRVEEALRCDPANVYAYMDFDTRDCYRKVVERLARSTGREEEEVAWKAIELALENLTPELTESSLWGLYPKLKLDGTGSAPRDSEQIFQEDHSLLHGTNLSADAECRGFDLPRATHVGFYLRDEGRTQFEASLGYRPPLSVRLQRWMFAHPTLVYLGSIILFTLIILLGPLAYAYVAGGTPVQLVGVGLLILLPATAVASSLVNRLITHTVPPRVLPKMDFQRGIPVECSTMVVVPALLTDADEIQSLLQQLELHFLGNEDPHLRFALLTDFADAPQKHMPDDDLLIEQIKAGILDLNKKHRRGATAPFYLFHREREWNPAEDCWMGWERKRGKLVEFNRLLRGGKTNYSEQVGDLDVLPEIKYVITLDADTLLPRDEARHLVATLAHPLNRAEFDPESRAVAAGYILLQPRVEITPTSAGQSLFAQVFAGDAGLDLYTRAVSDVYQDLFGEGIYAGKGIYEVAAFERSLGGCVPDNALLSHDLFEGIHGRVGLVTDVVLYEDYPSRYLAYTRRLHRWVRGDWQLLPWLLPRVPHADGGKTPNNLSILSRWKILDNLRRSLLAPALLAMLLAGWLWLPGSALVWTVSVMLALATMVIAGLITLWVRRLRGAESWTVQSLWMAVLRWLLALAFLPYETLIMVDAIASTLVRLTITHKRLLQWTTTAHTIRLFGKETKLGLLWRQMWGASLLSLGLAVLVWLVNPAASLIASPLLLVWIASPYVAYWVSRPVIHEKMPLSADQRQQLRRLARRTWLYFERFVGPDDHWLPPDHFQENPRGLVARRTSPTNIGLLLLSTLAAYDLGYVSLMDLALRLRLTFESMGNLAWYRGHFLNWYDTRDLRPLPPRYVSTVDSGNLAGCLLALEQGLQDLLHIPVLRWERLEGILDTLDVLAEIVDGLEKAVPETTVISLQTHIARIRQRTLAVKDSPGDWVSLLDWLEEDGWIDLEQLLFALVAFDSRTLDAAILHDLRVWSELVRYQLSNVRSELELLLPWLVSLQANQVPSLFVQPDTDPAVAEAWQTLLSDLRVIPALDEVPGVCRAGRTRLDQLQSLLTDEIGPANQVEEALTWCRQLAEELDSARMVAEGLVIGYQDLSEQAESYFQAMDFGFLFNTRRQVFHIGYNVESETLDSNYYDLLASEARIASLLAIAKGDVPQSHWLHLARPVTQVNGARVLLSWGGTMFEYLMPSLLIQDQEGTLLEQSNCTAVDYQIAYARRKGVPWGISESGYYRFDTANNYQYRGFGVPGLGFKRGLSEDLVISSYASLLALAIRPQAVLENIEHLIELQMLGRYGFYEAIDYTDSRLPPGQKSAIVHSYMVHHQGMALLSMVNYLQSDNMVCRFHADPRVQSIYLLLQERVPHQAPVEYPYAEEVVAALSAEPTVTIAPWHVPVDTPMPQVHVLSNGRYSLLITGAGGGYSSWQGVDLTRWRADTTLDDWGTWIYIQERGKDGGGGSQDDHVLWSAGIQPVAPPPEDQEVLFYAHKVEFRRRDHDISLRMEVTVPSDDVEVRHITLTNHSDRTRRLTLTSYGEVVLAPQSVDRRHPAFNRLFIESEYLPELNGLLFHRRPRSDDEAPIHLIHMLIVERGQEITGAYESDRACFLGRGGTVCSPAALSHPPPLPSRAESKGRGQLSGTTGATLDPIMALGQKIKLGPHATVQMAYITLAAQSRHDALTLAGRYHAWPRVQRAFDQARSYNELGLQRLNLATPEVERIQQLLSVLLYPHAALRARPTTLAANSKGQPGLWAYAISGDYPILLARVESEDETDLVRELLQAHTYWRSRQVKIDLVILNERKTGYDQELQGQLLRLITRMHSDAWLNQRGGVFVLRADQMSGADRVLLETSARAILDGGRGSLAEQLKGLRERPVRLPSFVSTSLPPSPQQLEGMEGLGKELAPPLVRPTDLLFDNGLGGFSPDGREYVIYLEPDQWTPAPWINVVANPDTENSFGFLVSESGAGYTWAGNSGENRLTPWRNDPVTDAPGEVLYLRDEEVGHVWSPTILPAGAPAPYLVRHGAGYSIFEHNSHGLKQQLRLFAVPDASVKIVHLQLENTWNRNRRITATFYAEWVLGPDRDVHQQYVIPEFDAIHNALLARNPYNEEFGERVAFLSASKEPHGLTADRTEFLGRGGSLRHPAALNRVGLTSTVQAGLDPCAVYQVHVWLAPGETEEVFFLLGQGADRGEVLRLVERYQAPAQVEAAWEAVNELWDDLLGTVTVQTPDPAMDLLLNRWLLYQALACRVWGRSALYQSSGAFGYRDQLQDVMALVHVAPDIVREHILRAARHQFEAGDVLHWWHPPSGRGVRTRCSDDLLWLPFVTAHYVSTTGDETIMTEKVPFLKGDPLEEEEKERYGLYEATAKTHTLYEHCCRALEKGTTAGQHGLPLIGSHDWNDGLSRVGIEGRGESIWLGWFLYGTLTRFASLCERMGDDERAAAHRQQARDLSQALEANGWDGDWYRRAYYDDGTPLGSAENRECQIDSIAQSWAVLSGAADPARAAQAMKAVADRLVRHNDRVVLLFTPPFDETPRDPGYIKGYLPGIRENGGQYTHAALWATWAFAELGQGDRAEALFWMLNPIYHGDTLERVMRYRVEPYVVAADVYSVEPHVGRGGWTWYTGSASWMLRVGLEAILGFQREGKVLRINPCIPIDWPGYELSYRYGDTSFLIRVENLAGVNRGVRQVILDGGILPGGDIPLLDDGRRHEVHVLMGESP